MHEGKAEKRITPEQFAENNGISRNTVYRMLKRGELVAFKIGAQWRIDEAATLDKLAATETR